MVEDADVKVKIDRYSQIRLPWFFKTKPWSDYLIHTGKRQVRFNPTLLQETVHTFFFSSGVKNSIFQAVAGFENPTNYGDAKNRKDENSC